MVEVFISYSAVVSTDIPRPRTWLPSTVSSGTILTGTVHNFHEIPGINAGILAGLALSWKCSDYSIACRTSTDGFFSARAHHIQRGRYAVITRINRLPIVRFGLGAVPGTTRLISRTSLNIVGGLRFAFIAQKPWTSIPGRAWKDCACSRRLRQAAYF